MNDNTIKRLYECHYCKKKIVNENTSSDFSKAHEGYSDIENVSSLNVGQNEIQIINQDKSECNIDLNTEMHICKNCYTKFPTRKNTHLNKVHTERVIQRCCKKLFFNVSSLQTHKRRYHKDVKFTCDECKIIFVDCYTLQRHKQRIHRKEKPYACSICNECFFNRDDLHSHECRIHNKVYACEFCRKEFSDYSSLSKHIKRAHSIDPYSCNYCERRCATTPELEAHESSHSNKNFSCTICNVQFTHRKSMRYHNRVKHSNNARPYQCKICKKSFTAQFTLKVHLRMHTGSKPYKCRFCDKTFARDFSLKTHETIHNGVKFYMCDVCSKQFYRNCDLRRHLKRHNFEQNIVCIICQLIFTKKRDLNKHMREVHRIKSSKRNPIKLEDEIPISALIEGETENIPIKENIIYIFDGSNTNKPSTELLIGQFDVDNDQFINLKYASNGSNKDFSLLPQENEENEEFPISITIENMNDKIYFTNQSIDNSSILNKNSQILNENSSTLNENSCIFNNNVETSIQSTSLLSIESVKTPFDNTPIDIPMVLAMEDPSVTLPIIKTDQNIVNPQGTETDFSINNEFETFSQKCEDKCSDSSLENVLPAETIVDIAYSMINNTTEYECDKIDEKLQECFQCNLCDNHFTSKISLKVHLRSHTNEKPYKCTLCNKKFSTTYSYRCHKQIHTGIKLFTCEICSKSFYRLTDLNIHKITHTEIKRHSCTLCEKKFRTSTSLKSHLLNIHPGESPYQCSLCKKKVANRWRLYLHSKLHEDVKKISCETCGKYFKHKSVLEVHMRKHTGEKPFECKICYRRFAQTSTLKKHELIHKQLKPFKCDQCDRCFYYKYNLLEHEKLHLNDVKCDFCEATFYSKNNLKIHLAEHFNERVPTCDFCGKKFYSDLLLSKHVQRQHSFGESIKPVRDLKYPCVYCKKEFTTKFNLHRHMKNVHGDK